MVSQAGWGNYAVSFEAHSAKNGRCVCARQVLGSAKVLAVGRFGGDGAGR